jgi:gliding motility-associated-like protein
VTNTSCNQNTGAIVVGASGGTGNLSFNWTGGLGTNPALSNIGAGDYQVTVTDENGCSTFANFTVGLDDDFIVIAGPSDSTIAFGATVELFGTTQPGISNPTYSWSPASGLSCTDCPNPVAGPSNTTAYVLTVTAENGCSQSDTVFITVILPCGEVFFPTIFSPNDDNLNDQLCVLGPCIQSSKYSIFNRLGELVFSSDNQNECWDGTFRNRPAPVGVYAFQLEVVLTDGTTVTQKGNVTLVK